MEKFYKPLIAIVTFYTMHYVSRVIMNLVLIFYNIDFLKSWFTGSYTEEQYAIMGSPTITGISRILGHLLVFSFLYVATITNQKTVISTSHIKWKYVIPIITFSFMLIMAFDGFINLASGSLNDAVEGYPYHTLTFISLCITGPIIEETIFRESILGNLVRNNMNTWTAILISSTIFAILHFNVVTILPNFVFGIITGILYVKTKSIVASSILHIINNTMAFLVYADYSTAVSSFTQSTVGLTTYIATITVMFIISICAIGFYWKRG